MSENKEKKNYSLKDYLSNPSCYQKYFDMKLVVERYLSFEYFAFVNKMIEDNTIPSLLEAIAQYLIYIRKEEPLKAELIIKRYLLLALFRYLDLNGYPQIKEFVFGKHNDTYYEDIYLKDIEEPANNAFFAQLYNDSKKDAKDAMKDLRNKIKAKKEKVENVAYVLVNYFSENNNPVLNNEYPRIDLIVAKALSKDKTFAFKFEIVDFKKAIEANVLELSSVASTYHKSYIIMLGHIIHKLMEYGSNNVFDISSTKMKILTMEKDCSFLMTDKSTCRFGFIDYEKENEKAMFNKKCVEFEFKYADGDDELSLYKLTKNGIKKI